MEIADPTIRPSTWGSTDAGHFCAANINGKYHNTITNRTQNMLPRKAMKRSKTRIGLDSGGAQFSPPEDLSLVRACLTLRAGGVIPSLRRYVFTSSQ